MTRRRIVLVTGPDAGHAFPIIGLAVALRDRGHEVHVGSGSGNRSFIEGEDLGYLDLPLLAPTPGDADIAHRIWNRAAEMAPPLADLIDERVGRPDIVISDTLTRAGAWAADLLAVPWVEMVPHHLVHVSDDLPPHGLGLRPSRAPWRRWNDARIRAAQRASRAQGWDAARAARRRIGLDGLSQPRSTLVCAVPAIEPPRSDWPEGTYLVGSMGWEPPWGPLEPPPGTEPLVLVTDSTASTVESSVAAAALDGLEHAGVRVVVTSTRHDLQPWGNGRSVVGRSAHGPLLAHASVAVGPGGGGFVAKALTAGVPLVTVPLMGDQRETAGRLRSAGLGLSLRPGNLRPGSLRRAVLRVLADDRFGRNAQRAARYASELGPEVAADLVESVVGGGS
ncbi:MAG: glycosyltransferase [Nitriliruptorales bacterium]|nr:glycosyltransferase [Nitriliruptorales bacterium]